MGLGHPAHAHSPHKMHPPVYSPHIMHPPSCSLFTRSLPQDAPTSSQHAPTSTRCTHLFTTCTHIQCSLPTPHAPTSLKLWRTTGGGACVMIRLRLRAHGRHPMGGLPPLWLLRLRAHGRHPMGGPPPLWKCVNANTCVRMCACTSEQVRMWKGGRENVRMCGTYVYSPTFWSSNSNPVLECSPFVEPSESTSGTPPAIGQYLRREIFKKSCGVNDSLSSNMH